LTNSHFSAKEKSFPTIKGQKMTEIQQVVRMADYTNNCLQISPEQAIQDLQEFLQENSDFDKIFLIAANTKGGDFNYAWFKGRMLCSEAITALHLSLDDQVQALKGGDF